MKCHKPGASVRGGQGLTPVFPFLSLLVLTSK